MKRASGACRFHVIQAFTLIELLIVVAIIAILAAIALPNFMEAQIRSKISRNKSDLRTIALALETYRMDSNQYPVDIQFYQVNPPYPDDPGMSLLNVLTTPIAYTSSIPQSGFKAKEGPWDGDRNLYGYKSDNLWRQNTLAEGIARGGDTAHFWAVYSVGPDEQGNCGEWMMYGEKVLNQMEPFYGSGPGCVYDATNGSRSAGDIIRVGP